jgi:uncharacterized RDD family membrane protein YckC
LKAIALRAFITIGVASIFVWFFWINKEDVGYFAESQNGATHVQGGTTPGNIVMSLFGIALFCLLMRMELRVEDFRAAPLWRRFAAFLIDFMFSLLTLSGIAAIFPLLSETLRTGTFKWHFERNHFVAFDAVNAILILLYMGALIMYFAFPLTKRRQTLGCFILRIATLSAGESLLYLPLSTALWRVFKEFSGLCSPMRTIKERDSHGRTWYDRETGFTVVSY